MKISVHRGHLIIEDGVGRSRRTRRDHKATAGLSRLVILGYSGFITFEAARWLADAKIQVIHLDHEGRILSVSARSPNLPALRRAQAQALSSPVGVEVVRELLTLKVGGQVEVANRLGGPDPEMNVALGMIGEARDIDALRIAEARAAFAYWRLWADVPIEFAQSDREVLPEHWLTFGVEAQPSPVRHAGRSTRSTHYSTTYTGCSKPKPESPRSPSVSTQDWGFSTSTRHPEIASPSTSWKRAGQPSTAYVLDLLEGHLFTSADFVEPRAGGCRIAPRLAHHLTNTTTLWAQQLAQPAEQAAQRLASRTRGPRSAVPTRLAQTNRRRAQGNIWAVTSPRIAPFRRCSRCNEPTEGKGSLCELCRAKIKEESGWNATGRDRLADLRSQGKDPAHGGAAGARRGAKISRENRKSRQWDKDHEDRPHSEVFLQKILLGLAEVPLRAMSDATGLSIDYCSKMRRGLKVPHPRHWDMLRKLSAEAT